MLAEQWVASHSPPMTRTPVIKYPSGVLINIQEYALILAPLAAVNVEHRPRILHSIESGELVMITLEAYQASDRDGNGFLSWNDGEIRDFITRVFQHYGLSVPSEGQMFELYSQFDLDRSSYLDARECLCLVDSLFRSVFFIMEDEVNLVQSPSYPPQQHWPPSRNASSDRPSVATFILTPPPSDGGVIAYDPRVPAQRGGQVPASGPPPPRQADAWMWPQHAADADAHLQPQQPLLDPRLEAQRPLPAAGAGVPFDGAPWPDEPTWGWADLGSMFGFGSRSPRGEPPPVSHQWPQALLEMDPPRRTQPQPPQASFQWPDAAPPPNPPTAGPGKVRPYADQPRPYQVYHSDAPPRGGQGLLPPSAAVAAATGAAGAPFEADPRFDVVDREQGREAAQNPWPEEAWSFKSLVSVFGGGRFQDPQPAGPPTAGPPTAGPPTSQAAPNFCAACGNKFMEGSRFCRKCGAQRPEVGAPQSSLWGTQKDTSYQKPSWKQASIDPELMPHGKTPTPQAAPPPPSAAGPEVPMWREVDQLRKHVIEIDLEEVRLHHQSPDLIPGWHETTTYYVSVHPFDRDPSPPLEAPKYTKEGEYLVSQAVGSKEPPVKNGHARHVPFKEKLVLNTDRAIPNAQVLLWGKKGNIAHSEIILVGKTVISLFDYRLQRKLIPWNVMDLTVDMPVAEMFMRYEVKTTPAAVQLLHLTDVKQTQVTLHWSKPLNDHGSPVQGYKINILLTQEPGKTEGSMWHTLCECTKTLHTAFVVENLKGNTEYLVNVMAVNQVGAGDSYEFQIQTAPVEPSAPPKPWIQEARDGCLCIAWHSSDQDGGTPVTAYKVQMMKNKVTGNPLSKLFGPAPEKSAAWAEIGSVGAVMDELKDQPSVYTVWAGPLDDQSTEYRFRVYAMNNAGVSEPSALTDPHYT